jgi:hypothetical protein
LDPLSSYTNVFFDTASKYELSAIHDRLYLFDLLMHLQKELKDDFLRFNFFILSAHNPGIIPASAALTTENKVLIWFGDESGIFPDHLRQYYLVIFKSYLKREEPGIYANHLGYVNEFKGIAEDTHTKDIDVFFSGNRNNNRLNLYIQLLARKYAVFGALWLIPVKYRSKIVRRLKLMNVSSKKAVYLFSVGWKGGLLYAEYFNYLRRSKFVLCPRGFERTETFRHIESLHAGCIVISEPLPDISLYKNHPFLTYTNPSGLTRILDDIGKGKYDVTALQEQHLAFYRERLTVQAVAARMASNCRAHLDIPNNKTQDPFYHAKQTGIS